MKKLLLFLCLVTGVITYAQQTENVIIITTDGFRWEEVFNGMDSAIANQEQFHHGDSSYLFKTYWSDDVNERRKKLMPFTWNTIAVKGQLYGNRLLGNKVNNANPYWFSYPGYSEIMCGYVDTAINSNGYKHNPNTNLLEFFNHQPALKGKVAAFCAWDAFDKILNEPRSGVPVVSAFDSCGGNNPSASEHLINAMMKDSYKPFGMDECLDVFTQYEAMEYLKNKKPKVLYISYGETDEWAHAGKYKSYLEAAHQVDAWIQEIWNFVQHDLQYRDKTTIFFTTDHGRGDIQKNQWIAHGKAIEDAYQIWCAVLGPGVNALGEVKTSGQLYQKQFAQTIAKLMGYTFVAEHPVAEAIRSVVH